MQAIKRYLRIIMVLVVLVMAGYIFTEFYSFIFSRKVKGVIESVERVELNVALMQNSGAAGANQHVDPALFSFSVAIREPSGEIVTSSAEDRQWAVAQKGLCVEAVLYPYPPWKVMKSGTYFNARLDKMYDCNSAQAQ